ncbi:DNA replication licensing factor mcm10 [Fulvia fulva]|uniref:DNA replication licensing factor mcm10 n=1 Tax=Passalora fulva TaxID=5499 RepID=A0A9Q8PC47_PASFU|nr:DNA replication licensing factor mcm10 [Fulvia fulva]KAK4620822.1 DNA replication licensing factor mcm10 [Fulvia fulva]UJO19744.1 DNA replication licensing factor mcm10 [Fulvia fulva]WPV32526.1 DNA replication licensing factor mcm10 [Fulvia fulva]
MVVVRESPRSKLSPDKNTTQWPPKSPFQALLSSPSGRKRWQDRQSRAGDRSPSPSPSKPLRSTRALDELADMDDEDGDEDEETLQLQLQAIQAKLKLKKLQAKQRSSGDGASSGRESRQDSVRSSSPRTRNISPTRLYKAAVEVPLSPVRNVREPQEQLSPARQRLGLPAVRRAEAVSLKRSSHGNQIKRSRSHQSLQSAIKDDIPKVSSFSQRLAQSKTESDEKKAKQERIEKVRSSGFAHRQDDTVRTQQTPNPRTARTLDTAERPLSAGQARGREPATSGIRRSDSARTPREDQQPRARPKPINPGAYGQDSGTGHAGNDSDKSPYVEDVDDDAGYDPFSKVHLKKRHIQHSVVAREMEGKEIYTLPRLLKEVKSPEYEPPDCETDYILFAVLASKSSPLDQQQSHKSADKSKEDYDTPRNKFMVLKLCDLKWEIDCFLFGTAFNQFWKLTPGTLLAIMNPAILPPKGNQHDGKFSLKLGSSEDAVMEVGLARDLGYCSATKRDGQKCTEWIDKRKTEACEFHLNLQIEKARKGNMTVNTMFRGTGNPQDRIKSKVAKDAELRKKKIGGQHHREYGQLYHVAGNGKSAASLLDSEDMDALHNMTQEEASRKRLANAQKERDLAKKLGEMGSGPGAEYLRPKHTTTTTITSTTSHKATASEEARKELFAKPSASELGLLGKKSTDVHMSPPKDRKKHFGLGAISMANNSSGSKSSTPMGWGGAKKAGLIQPKESRLGSPERGQTKLSIENTRPDLVRPRSQNSSLRSAGSSSPIKKKARYLLEEKGIRTPGRDSLPGAGVGVEDDDDDLDIV